MNYTAVRPNWVSADVETLQFCAIQKILQKDRWCESFVLAINAKFYDSKNISFCVILLSRFF